MRGVPSPAALGLSLGMTLALELPVAYLWGLRGRRNLTLAVLVNVLTNPPVVLGYYLLSARTLWPPLAIQLSLEALAVLTEGWCYARCGRDIRRPYLLSLCANGFSYGMGLLLGAVL